MPARTAVAFLSACIFWFDTTYFLLGQLTLGDTHGLCHPVCWTILRQHAAFQDRDIGRMADARRRQDGLGVAW